MPRGVGRVGDGNGPKEWIESLPPVTRAWFLASLTTTTLVSFGLLSAQRVVWIWPLVYHKFELWRLVTPFVFFGTFSFPLVINLFLLVQYSKNYELGPYDTGAGGSTADYVWMLILGAIVLCAASTLLNVYTPSVGLLYMVMYVWTRRNPTMPVSLYGFQLKALHLPWALLALNLVMGNSVMVPIMGIVTGHVYYFVLEPLSDLYGVDGIVRTPNFLITALDDAGMGSGVAAHAQAGGQGYRATPPPGRRPGDAGAAGAAGGRPAANPNNTGLFQRRAGGHNWGTGRALGTE